MYTKENRSRGMRIKAGISILLFGGLVLLSDARMALPCLLAAAFHECGHLIAARLLGVRLSAMKLDLFGARITVSNDTVSYRDEFLLCAAGPFFSFLLYILLSSPYCDGNELFTRIGEASVFLGILNLLPVRGFDGGRMLSSLISALASPFWADAAERLFTGIFLILLWGISVYLLLLTGAGLIPFVFSVGLFCKIFLS